MENLIRVLIVDDHAIVREGLRAIIGLEKDMQVIGEADDGVKAVQLVRELEPDVIIMDLVMPKGSGLEAISKIMQSSPSARILVLTSFAEVEKIFLSIKFGALGYVIKDSDPKELLKAIRDVAHGAVYLSPEISRQLSYALKLEDVTTPSAISLDQLTARELEILRLVAQGQSNEEIAQRLQVSPRTVGVHVSHILEKLNLSNRTQAALYALRVGLVTL